MMIKKNMQINEIAMQELMKPAGQPASSQAQPAQQVEQSAF